MFAETKKQIAKICNALNEADIKSLPYSQDLSFESRSLTMMWQKNNKVPVLVCNNLVSRGLDTMNVEHVI